jgi:hypothetical protein
MRSLVPAFAFAVLCASAAPARADALPAQPLAPTGRGLLAASGWLRQPAVVQLSPGLQCRQAIQAAEAAAGIPERLLAAIGRVESGRREADGSINPWPWSINVEGKDRIFDSKAEAVGAVQALQARGVRSIDVGCMQVNLMYHPDAFATLNDAFDPVMNARYAARFLVQLRERTGSWQTATAWYHSATPELGADYQRKVMAVWPEEKAHSQDTPRLAVAAAGQGLPMAPYGRPGGFTLSGRAARAPPLPLARLAPARTGRTLADYRAAPIPLASLRPVSATLTR